jgi:hypothetical protein
MNTTIGSSSFDDQDDVEGYADLGVWSVFLGVGSGIGYFGVKTATRGDGQAAWLGQQALTTAQNGRGILNAGRPQ